MVQNTDKPTPKASRGRWAKFRNGDLCTHCGYCLPHCPTYRVENNEYQSPRGRVSIILAARAGTVGLDEAVEAVSHCLVCRACHAACPAGVRPGKLVLMTRGLAPQPEGVAGRLFHGVTDRPVATGVLAGLLDLYVRSGMQAAVRGSRLLGLVPPVKRLESLTPAHRFRQRKTPADAAPERADGRQKRIGLLCGCMARLFFPQVGGSAVQLLESLGCRVVVPGGFGCCGAPYREQGQREGFLNQARRVLDAFARQGTVDVVVCDSSVCAITARSYAKSLARDEHYKELAADFSAKVMDLGVFLARELDDPAAFFGDPGLGRITFHDHCQARHGLGTLEEPRRLLNALPGGMTELPRNGQCCGAGGSYMLQFPQRSRMIRQDKLQAVAESEADTVIGMNPGCLLNIQAGLADQGSVVQVRHLAEVLWLARQARQNAGLDNQ